MVLSPSILVMVSTLCIESQSLEEYLRARRLAIGISQTQSGSFIPQNPAWGTLPKKRYLALLRLFGL